jgi:RNA polymerase sigma-70 factor, ECF subfamily
LPVYDLAEQELIIRCQKGDVSAFKEVYYIYGTLLYRLALRMLCNRQDAEDVVQTVFVKLYQNISQFRQESRLRTYLVRMALNVCFDQLQSRRPLLELDETVPSTATTEPEMRLVLQQAIDDLPERMRACFILFAVEGWPQQEIAEALHISLGSVKSHIFQAKARMRSFLPERLDRS